MSVKLLALILVVFCSGALAAEAGQADADETTFIAGLEPDRRPADAPVIREFHKDANWYRRSLKGIAPPYSNSLRFLEDQGAWYTPFDRPNATGPYDIRGLHPATTH